MRDKDAGSARTGGAGATEDALSRRRAHPARAVNVEQLVFPGMPRDEAVALALPHAVTARRADVEALVTGALRGAFEYQGQKCSAASRAYVPRSLWRQLEGDLVGMTEALTMGPVTDLSNFMGAVIDDKAYADHVAAIERARSTSSTSIIAGGTYDDREGWFVRPTLVLGEDPTDEVFTAEYFGPILAVHVYPDRQFGVVMRQLDAVSRYALTGSIIAQDRAAIAEASEVLRFAAGNFYINDKPTGAVVGQQPFGGARASGTNDKAGSYLNLIRWTSQRTIKENFVPPKHFAYPFLGEE